MTGDNALGEYLRRRRGQVRPEDVGLIRGSRRRVEGLRREELAALAGMSADYYLRIEQGRNANPSLQILEALARVLRLDAAATAHLHELARDNRATYSDPEVVSDDILTLIDQLPMPAFVAGRCLDCLASNPLARALSPNFTPGRNLLRQLFLDPAERELHADWDDATAGVVSGLRQVAGGETTDPRLHALVEELCASSPRFEMLWERADIGYRPAGASHMYHPRVGELHLRRNRLTVPDSDGQHLQIYHALPGTDTADKLARLFRS
ncbi:helix-turn-helix transcriptional regulator [Mycolicibacterium mengxianglii]|uniref:helix-turn-helix transcriptional regulator n=1 Tax=Mycolicibacterium mengxianglii TaxID=2736649 RepID=UPI0018D0B0C0|nr:helix-turn-helix transcriptional regulator [Mycolicibacterium mengxianglii]